jgi:hypothetical protein
MREQTQFDKKMKELLSRLQIFGSNAEALAAIGANKPYLAGAGHVGAYPGELLISKAE